MIRPFGPASRLTWALLASVLVVPGCSGPASDAAAFLTELRNDWIVSEAEAIRWHELKDEKGPALTGNASWQQFVGFVEDELNEHGVIDIQRNEWTFDRWHTSEWPDRSQWSLVSDGKSVEVANYGANSGSTGPDGVTAELVYVGEESSPVDLAGKIAVFSTAVAPALVERFANADYEYLSEFDSYPETGQPVPEGLNNTQSAKIFLQLVQVPEFIKIAVQGGAVGAIFVLDGGRDLSAGIYTFPVPAIYDVPSLYVDREIGRTVIEDAIAGAQATLKLEGETTESTAYQLIGFLPGNKYGTPDDEIVQLTTHTDGPSISQDNGAFGILGVIQYMSNIPRADRPRTLMVFLDCRHFMPGAEYVFEAEDWFARNPGARDRITGVIGIEHLGQIEYVEEGDSLVETGRLYPSHVWATDNDRMVEMAVKAVDDNGLASAYVRNVARAGIHGRSQGQWFGMAKFAPKIGVPAFAIMGFMGAYWATSSDIKRFDSGLFRRQVATMTQLTGELMTSDLSEIATDE